MAALMLWACALTLYVHPAPSDRLAQEIGVILPGNEEWSLYNLAHILFDAGAHDVAIAMLRATTELNVTAWQYPAFLAGILGFFERCDEARAALHEARRRLSTDPPATSADKASVEKGIGGYRELFRKIAGKTATNSAGRCRRSCPDQAEAGRLHSSNPAGKASPARTSGASNL